MNSKTPSQQLKIKAMSSKTLGELGLRNFLDNGTSNKTKCPISSEISMDDYLSSKLCGQNNSVVPYSGQQIVNGLLSKIHDKVKGKDYKPEVGKVHVYRDHLRYDGYVEKETAETKGMTLLTPAVPIQDIVFERAIGKIKLIDAGEYSQIIAFKYEPKFLEIAIGTEVNICSNYNIFGGKHYVSDRSFKYEEMMAHFESILIDIQQHFQMDLMMIEQMKRKAIGQADINTMLGNMMQQYHRKEVIIPLTDISAVSENIINRKEPINNVWDFVNAGTEVLRFDNNSGDAILGTIKNFNEYTSFYTPIISEN